MGLIDFSLGDIGNVFKDIREAITGEAITDPNKKAEIEYKLELLENQLKQGQIAINEKEAQSPNLFVSGWRPSIGWIGSMALGYTFVVSPLLQWYCNFKGIMITPPVLDTSMLFNLVLAMLGLGGMRTFEKVKNVQNRH